VSGVTEGRVGIDHVVQLMRSLEPSDNVELVAHVMRMTLESLNIRVADIIQDGGHRLQELEKRIAELRTEIAALQRELELRAEEIRRLEAAHAETTRVKNHFEHAHASGEKGARAERRDEPG
jgi:hypothetical protein